VVRRQYNNLIDITNSFQFEENQDAKTSFTNHIRQYVTYFTKHPHLLRIIYLESLSKSPRLQKIIPQILEFGQLTTSYLQQLKNKNLAPDIPIKDLRFLFNGCLTFRFVHPHLVKTDFTCSEMESVIEDHTNAIVKLFIRD